MKLIIDINDNEYMGIKGYPNNITSYPVTIHIYNAIRKGIPLEDAIDKIRAEIEEYKSRQLALAIGVEDLEKGKQTALEYVLAIIDKYKAESEEV